MLRAIAAAAAAAVFGGLAVSLHGQSPAAPRLPEHLGYPASGKKDGRWHAIRVEVRNHSYRVRTRRGYLAS